MSGGCRRPVVHWYRADPYKRMVMLAIGAPREAVAALAKAMKPPKDVRPDFDRFAELLEEDLPYDNPAFRFCQCGKCVTNPAGDSLMWFPRIPDVSTLVHELLHATQAVLKSAGVQDEAGEADAYLMTSLAKHFLVVLARDVRRTAKVPWSA